MFAPAVVYNNTSYVFGRHVCVNIEPFPARHANAGFVAVALLALACVKRNTSLSGGYCWLRAVRAYPRTAQQLPGKIRALSVTKAFCFSTTLFGILVGRCNSFLHEHFVR